MGADEQKIPEIKEAIRKEVGEIICIESDQQDIEIQIINSRKG